MPRFAVPSAARRPARALAMALLLAVLAAGCVAQPEGTYRETIHLSGSHYDRGLEHGKRLKHRIRAFYTKLLGTALLPNLNREQPAIQGFLTRYAGPTYADGQFSYRVLLEMAQSVETQLPERYKDEMRGIAEGCGLTYEQVLILNTFPDTVLAVRSIAATLRFSRGPQVVRWQVLGQNGTDGKQVPEQEYASSDIALATEVPTDARIRLVLADPDGVKPETVRLQLDTTVYEPGDPAISTKVLETKDDEPKELEVVLTPKGGMPAAAALSLIIEAADTTIADDPLPAHPRFGRIETLTISTEGFGEPADAIPNTGVDDGRFRPPPVAFAAKGKVTADGTPLLAQHFALLDAGAAHEATVLFVHDPPPGESTSQHAYLAWAGLTWGFSGMSERGVAWACNFSDTLDTAILKDLIPQLSKIQDAQLTATGWPIGLAMREVSRDATTADAGAKQLSDFQHVNGWNCLLADKDGGQRLAEIDADAEAIPDQLAEGVTVVKWNGSPESSPASDTEDDLRAAVHYVEKIEDVDPALTILAEALLAPTGTIVRLEKQRSISTYFFKSLRAFVQLGQVLAENRGTLTVEKAQEILADKRFVDFSDSMNAVVFEPAAGRIHHAMGAVPATDAIWETFSFGGAK